MKRPSFSDDVKKAARRAAKLGAVLGLSCHLLPTEYRVACEFLADVCRGNF